MSSLLVAALFVFAVLAAAVTIALVRARRRRRQRRPQPEPSAFVVLEANGWDACTVDDMREPWGRYTTEAVRGFCGVPPGRHRIRTTTSAGDATLDFVAYPGEVLAWRLDAERARWEPHDLEGETRAMLEGSPASSLDFGSGTRPKLPGWLVHLRTTMGLARSRSGVPAPAVESDSIDRIEKRLAKIVARAESEGESGDEGVLAEARALGEAIVGRPLTRKDMRALVASAREVAARLSSRGDTDRAMRVLALGLAVLPGDPELMVVQGWTLAARGDVDEALRALEAALERDRCLEAEDVARAMRARMELRSRLGSSVRVGSA